MLQIVADFSEYSFSQKSDYSQDFKGSPFSLSIFCVISKMCNTFNNEIKVSLIEIPNKFHPAFPYPRSTAVSPANDGGSTSSFSCLFPGVVASYTSSVSKANLQFLN